MLFGEAMSSGKAGSGPFQVKATQPRFGEQTWRRLFVTLTLSSLISIGVGAISSPGWADSESDLTRLEIKFFQHSYPKDAEPARLDRLEKMVFGEVKTGADAARLSKLVEAIPASAQPTADAAPSGGSSSGSSNGTAGGGSSQSSVADQPRSQPGSRKHAAAPPPETADNDADEPVKTDEKYPAVTAIEQKILGKDYAGESVDKRLARLETKEFGKPSSSSMDLSDRVDALKQKTGIDVARLAPKGADWADDDDDIAVNPRHAPAPMQSMGSTNPREDAMSFSGRNMQEDFQKAFGMGSGGGSGSYGFGGGSSSSASGSYGMGAGLGSSYPSTPQSFRKSDRSAPSMGMDAGGGGSGGMGLNQQVSAVEAEIFQKSYTHDPLPVRLNRLEATVFPNDKTLADKSLPERVANLVAHVPISSTPSNSGRKVAKANKDDDMSDLMNMGSGMGSMTGLGGMSNGSMAQQPVQKSGGGGLGKIINSIGSMLGGGGMGMGGYTGGYPMTGGALATDPSTGMLYDPTSGNLIDPNTGAVVGRRAPVNYGYNSGYPMGGTGYGANYGYNGGGFNNGFAPYGSLNRSFGPSFGFGTGGGRMGGIGGMWP